MKIRNIGLASTLIYTTIALVASGLFLLVTLLGEYSWVSRLGGTGWVFLLSMIILMPLVTSLVKKKYGS
jgi:hypothetical protein